MQKIHDPCIGLAKTADVVTDLKLTNYKNYRSGSFCFPERLNFIVGRNGIGKTNLLDAIYYLCMARSHNTTKELDTVMFGQGFLRLDGEVMVAGRKHTVEVKVRPGKLKEIILDGKSAGKLSDYVGFIPVVMLAPEDVVLVRGGSAARRRFLDMIACQTDRSYLEHLQRYQKLLSQRNALLRTDGFRADKILLRTYASSMADAAAFIHAFRKDLVAEILPEVVSYYGDLSSTAELPDLQYHSQLETHSFEELSNDSIENDRAAGFTTKGIHRDDLVIRLDGKPAKKFGSQGQVKSLLIAMHMAQAIVLLSHTNRHPILLLDDIFDRLDDYRAQKLIEMLAGFPAAQVFISDASPAQMRALIALSETQADVIELTDDDIGNRRAAENRNLPRHDNEEE